jgi:hypothetical protein
MVIIPLVSFSQKQVYLEIKCKEKLGGKLFWGENGVRGLDLDPFFLPFLSF